VRNDENRLVFLLEILKKSLKAGRWIVVCLIADQDMS
jgi:hypothetical protein